MTSWVVDKFYYLFKCNRISFVKFIKKKNPDFSHLLVKTNDKKNEFDLRIYKDRFVLYDTKNKVPYEHKGDIFIERTGYKLNRAFKFVLHDEVVFVLTNYSKRRNSYETYGPVSVVNVMKHWILIEDAMDMYYTMVYGENYDLETEGLLFDIKTTPLEEALFRDYEL